MGRGDRVEKKNILKINIKKLDKKKKLITFATP
jgi:hypothetical protein